MYWYGAVVVRGLATTSDKSPAVKFYCPVPHKEYILQMSKKLLQKIVLNTKVEHYIK